MNKIELALQKTRDTKFCALGVGAIKKAPEIFAQAFPGAKAIIVADVNTWKAAGEAIEKEFDDAHICCEAPYIIDDPKLYAEWSFVEKLSERLSKTEAIAIAVGSGTINDLCKYVSGTLGRKYMCCGTAASMDGYTSYGASITKDGNKQTFDCPAPYAVVIDTLVAAVAPKDLAASGYADLMAKIPAGADWMIADCVGAEPIDPFAWHLVQEGLGEAVSEPSDVRSGDLAATEKLCEGLLMSGFAMQAIQSSRPASGTEHQFSHAWDMEALAYPGGRHVSHGFKVGIGTLVSTRCLEGLLSYDLGNLDVEKCVENWPSWEAQEKEIRRLCLAKPAHLERCLSESREKYIGKEVLRERLLRVRSNWSELKERLQKQILPYSQVLENLKAVGAPYECEQICVSKEHLRETFDLIPYMRSRYTAIDLIYSIGLLEALRP